MYYDKICFRSTFIIIIIVITSITQRNNINYYYYYYLNGNRLNKYSNEKLTNQLSNAFKSFILIDQIKKKKNKEFIIDF